MVAFARCPASTAKFFVLAARKMQFGVAAHAAHRLSESCINIVSGRSQHVSLYGANAAARQFWQVAIGQWRHASSNYELQADHAAFGGIALPLAFGPHVG